MKMKKLTSLLLIALITLSVTLKAQIPNGDFQNWSTVGNYDVPAGWGNLNPLTASKNVFTCEKGVSSGSANLYIRLVSDSVEGIGVAPGIAVSGILDMITMKPKSGFPCTQRPSALTGKWQFMAQGDDPGFIAIYFTKWNTVTKKREVIGTGVDTLKGMEMSWASFSIPISFSNATVPDSCIIFLSASSNVPKQFSYLFVDDLSFDTGSGIVDHSSTAGNFKSFPNPVNDVLQMDLHTLTDIETIQLIDMQGRVLRALSSNQNMQAIDVSDFASGIYFIRVKTKSTVVTQLIDKL